MKHSPYSPEQNENFDKMIPSKQNDRLLLSNVKTRNQNPAKSFNENVGDDVGHVDCKFALKVTRISDLFRLEANDGGHYKFLGKLFALMCLQHEARRKEIDKTFFRHELA